MNNEPKQVARIWLVTKGAVLLAVYFACMIGALAPAISRMGAANPRTLMGAEYVAMLLLIPNVLSFAVSAWFLRDRWRQLLIVQIIVAGLIAAVATMCLMAVTAFLFEPILTRSAFVPMVAIRVIMLVPGIVGAQTLRMRQDRNPGSTPA